MQWFYRVTGILYFKANIILSIVLYGGASCDARWRERDKVAMALPRDGAGRQGRDGLDQLERPCQWSYTASSRGMLHAPVQEFVNTNIWPRLLPEWAILRQLSGMLIKELFVSMGKMLVAYNDKQIVIRKFASLTNLFVDFCIWSLFSTFISLKSFDYSTSIK